MGICNSILTVRPVTTKKHEVWNWSASFGDMNARGELGSRTGGTVELLAMGVLTERTVK